MDQKYLTKIFQLEDKYNLKEINFYEESNFDICNAGLIFEKNLQKIIQIN